MITIEGKGVYGAIAIGKLNFFDRKELTVKREKTKSVESEIERFKKAKKDNHTYSGKLCHEYIDEIIIVYKILKWPFTLLIIYFNIKCISFIWKIPFCN